MEDKGVFIRVAGGKRGERKGRRVQKGEGEKGTDDDWAESVVGGVTSDDSTEGDKERAGHSE